MKRFLLAALASAAVLGSIAPAFADDRHDRDRHFEQHRHAPPQRYYNAPQRYREG